MRPALRNSIDCADDGINGQINIQGYMTPIRVCDERIPPCACLGITDRESMLRSVSHTLRPSCKVAVCRRPQYAITLLGSTVHGDEINSYTAKPSRILARTVHWSRN